MTCIEVDNVSKRYRYGRIGSGSFQREIQSWWARIRGKDDPNTLIQEYPEEASLKNSNEAFWALKNINFSVNQGDIIGVVGRNGAGKSTLLKILSRVTAPTTGTVRIKGRIVSLLEVGTGFHPELTGRENIYLSGMIQGMTRKEIAQRMDEIIDFAEVERFIDTPVKRYSSGMYVRLAFSVAAHLRAEILILDEVLAVGDTKFQRKCQSKMTDVGGEGRTILYVSHNLNSVLALCNKAIHLSRGELVESGSASIIVNNYLKSFSDTAHGFHLTNSDKSFVINRIRLTDARDRAIHIFDMFSELNVEIYYEASKDMGKLAFSVGISGTAGGIGMASMLYDNKKTHIKQGKGCIICSFQDLSLMPGQNYAIFLNVRAPDNETPIVPTNDIASFEIAGDLKKIGYSGPLARQTAKVSSPVILKYKWRHIKK